MAINTTQLTTNLQTRLNNLTGTETPEEIFTLTAALNNLTSDRFMSVSKYSQLPNLTTNSIPSGSLVFVEALNVLMMSVGTQWRGVDGRVPVLPAYTAYAWGRNNNAQLGDNTTTNRSSPVSAVGGIITWSQVSAGRYHSAGITSAGIAYAWGRNSNGQLGDNTTTSRSSPVTVVGAINGTWTQITAGSYNSLGITSDGRAYGWGANNYGQVGDNTTTDRSSPVTVVGGINTWSQISAGRTHVLGRTSAGIAYAWGHNQASKLGDETNTNRSSPVTVVGGINNWSEISSGSQHSLGRTSAGVAYAWGYNFRGQLGNNSTAIQSSPVTVVGSVIWSQISTSPGAHFQGMHSLGLNNASVAYAWGYNDRGQLGDNTTTHRSSPVTVVGGISNWSQISAGMKQSLGRTSAGVAYAWGGNNYGENGDNSATVRSSPVTVVGGITAWTQVSGGGQHSLGIAVFGD